ncbi:MAG: DUF6902 family protein [Pseudooceanicola sp.]
MTNVVQLSFPSRAERAADRLAALAESFATARRDPGDVFWLKENAELLNILQSTGTPCDATVLSVYEELYAMAGARLSYFPQYYRFLLSICLDLEDLGLDHGAGERLVAWADGQGLARAELSDLQRAEARRLMLRRGRDPLPDDPGLTGRLTDFISRPATFALPNKKAAYELTHIVFYLSDYGRRPPSLGAEAERSLTFAGHVAWLEQNADLLAEICVAMRFAGFTPPPLWEGWIARQLSGFAVVSGAAATPGRDDYHSYFMCHWARATAGGPLFDKGLPEGAISLHAPAGAAAPLRPMAQALLEMGPERRGDWPRMRDALTRHLSPEARVILELAETEGPDFERFFAGFARADAPAGTGNAA